MSYEYAAGIQLASPGPTSRPSFLLNASPPASVTKFAAYYYLSAEMIVCSDSVVFTCVRLAKMTSVVIKALLDLFSVFVGAASKTRGDGRRLVEIWLTGRDGIAERGLETGAGLERSVRGIAST